MHDGAQYGIAKLMLEFTNIGAMSANLNGPFIAEDEQGALIYVFHHISKLYQPQSAMRFASSSFA